MIKGTWSQQQVMKNCGNRHCRKGCPESKGNKPHGPYAVLSRRDPDSGLSITLYLGKTPLEEQQLARLNERTAGKKLSKQEVFSVIREIVG